MKIYALQTAKASSEGVPGKNEILVEGIPLFQHNLMMASACSLVERIFCLTDIPLNHAFVEKHGIQMLALPMEIAKAEHYRAIIYGLEMIGPDTPDDSDIVVLLLGNSYGTSGNDLRDAIMNLIENPKLDSVCSVSSFNCFNPLRAWSVKDNHLVSPLGNGSELRGLCVKHSNDRATFGDIYFFNGSFWVARRAVLERNDGILPFPWLGTNIAPFVQTPRFELDHTWQLPYFKTFVWE